MESNNNKCIIIDNGSGSIKAGFSNEDAPSVTIPTVVGIRKTMAAGATDMLVGN